MRALLKLSTSHSFPLLGRICRGVGATQPRTAQGYETFPHFYHMLPKILFLQSILSYFTVKISKNPKERCLIYFNFTFKYESEIMKKSAIAGRQHF